MWNEDYGIPSGNDILESMEISDDMLIDKDDESDTDISFNVSPIRRKEDFNENQNREISLFIEKLMSIVEENLKTIVEHARY